MSDEIDGDAYRITWLIRRLSRAMGQRWGWYLEDLGISAADRAVMEFIYTDGKLSVPDIAKRYQASRQHVQATVNSLIDKSLAAAIDNPGHKRSPLITLTQHGRELFATVRARDQEAINELFSDVPPADRKRTREALEKLLSKV